MALNQLAEKILDIIDTDDAALEKMDREATSGGATVLQFPSPKKSAIA